MLTSLTPPPPQKREPGFPYNLEPLLFGRELRLPRGKARRLVVLKVAMRQLLEDLRDCHATGIVHRWAEGLEQRQQRARLGMGWGRAPARWPCMPGDDAPSGPPLPPCPRDFKPQNIIASAASQRLKLIDFGAAADLRLGINYVPNEYLLDPRWGRARGMGRATVCVCVGGEG